MMRLERVMLICLVALAASLPNAWAQVANPPEAATSVPEPPRGSPAWMAQGAHASHAIDVPPVLIHQVTPVYPKEARKKGLTGAVWLAVPIDENGVPQTVRVEHSIAPALDEAALQAVRGYRFKPAMKDGRPVPVEIRVCISFQKF